MANSTRFMIELPDVGADADQWGTILNNAFSSLEAKVTDRTAGDTISGPLILNGNLTANGNNTLGDALTDSHVVNGSIVFNGTQRTNVVEVSGNTIIVGSGIYFTKTINGNTTLQFDSPPSNFAFAFTLEINHLSGAITWPASVRWPENAPPVLTTNRTHVFVFVTDNAGVIWRGAALKDYLTT